MSRTPQRNRSNACKASRIRISGLAAGARVDGTHTPPARSRAARSRRRAGPTDGRQARAALRPRVLHLLRTRRASAAVRPLGARTGRGEGRCGRPLDAQPPRVSGYLARCHSRRRSRRTAQHQPRRAVPCALYSSCFGKTPYRRRGARQCARHGPAAPCHAAAGVHSRRMSRHRREDRKPRDRATRIRGVARDDHRRPRALHLHVGHHGNAQAS